MISSQLNIIMTKTSQNQKQKRNMSKKQTIQPPRYGSVVPTRTRINYGIARFSRVTDPIVVSAFASPPSQVVATSDASGVGSGRIPLCSIGVTGWNTTTSARVQIVSPALPWLYNTSRNFGSFRITQANLVVVGNLGANIPGSGFVHSTRDYSDTGTSVGTIAAGGIIFELAGLAARNKVIPLQIDNSWKKITSETTKVENAALVSVNSINDLLFTSIIWGVTGAPATAGCFTMYVEYDVEFANPMSLGLNN